LLIKDEEIVRLDAASPSGSPPRAQDILGPDGKNVEPFVPQPMT
jgi:hypothetical protein